MQAIFQSYLTGRGSLVRLQIFKTAMIIMLSNSLIEQLNVNRRKCHIAMKVVSADSFSSVVWWGARVYPSYVACAEVSTGSV
jgi:hypothetical protein